MKDRKLAREFCFKFLYQKVFNDSFELIDDEEEKEFQHFRSTLDFPRAQEDFIRDVLNSVRKYKDEIDELISKNLQQWTLNRISKIDRTLITLGVVEMNFIKSKTPVNVIINECIELSKKYGQDSSRSFVNGILDKIAKA